MKKLVTGITMVLFATHLLAQNPYEGIISVKEKALQTTFVLGKDLKIYEYKGDDLRAGVVQATVLITGEEGDGVDLILPADSSVQMSFTDVYGRVVMRQSRDVMFRIIRKLRYSDQLIEEVSCGGPVKRGGKYIYQNYIPALNYFYEQPFELIDDPSVFISSNKVKVGQDLQVKATFNTGYPYNPGDFNKNMKATLRLYALGKDGEGNDTETELMMAQKPLLLYCPDQPDVAAMDILQLSLCEAQPGEYRAKLSSDCTLDGANRDDIYISVCDTLRASARLLKPTFDASVDKVFKVHLKMKYGYPYIQKQENDERPTVHVYIKIVSKHMEEGIEVTLKYQENTPLERTNLEAQVRVEFNGETQYTATLPFVYIPASQTAVRQIERPATTGADAVWYDLQGRRQPDASTLGKGIFLTNGQKIVK